MKSDVVTLLIAVMVLLCGKTSAAQDSDTCRVALMVPLYLEQVNDEFNDETPSNKMLLTKPFSFLHFYEGFMIAADSMTNSRGLNLDLKVYDVDNDVNKAVTATEDPWLADADIIVGPFYIKPFEKVREYAVNNNILIVNPITQRSQIVEEQPRVVKIKPSYESQLKYLDALMNEYYHANNVFVVSHDGVTDSAMVNRINEIAEKNIDSVTYVDNRHIVNVIRRHHKRWSMLKVDFDESDFLTDNISINVSMLKQNIDDSTSFKNQIVNINYNADSLRDVKNYASSLRNNLFVVYGDDRIFADEIVNKVTKLTEYYPITVVMLPEWSKFDRLFNENLMKMKAIYFNENYVDYQSIRVLSFVSKFRERYGTEPQGYAFQGFDVAWYFLNAFKYYGDGFVDALCEFDIPLLQSEFRFVRDDDADGYENSFWNVYQYRGYNIVPIEFQDDVK